MRRVLVLGVIVLFLGLFQGCMFLHSRSAPLSNEEIRRFVEKTGINPLFIKNPAGEATVILYKSATEVGYYALFTSGGGGYAKLHEYRDIHLDEKGSDNTPILVVNGFLFDNAIIGLTINDRQLASKAAIVKVVFDDNYEVTDAVKNSSALVIRENAGGIFDYKNIILYDQSGNELFKSTSPSQQQG